MGGYSRNDFGMSLAVGNHAKLTEDTQRGSGTGRTLCRGTVVKVIQVLGEQADAQVRVRREPEPGSINDAGEEFALPKNCLKPLNSIAQYRKHFGYYGPTSELIERAFEIFKKKYKSRYGSYTLC